MLNFWPFNIRRKRREKKIKQIIIISICVSSGCLLATAIGVGLGVGLEYDHKTKYIFGTNPKFKSITNLQGKNLKNFKLRFIKTPLWNDLPEVIEDGQVLYFNFLINSYFSIYFEVSRDDSSGFRDISFNIHDQYDAYNQATIIFWANHPIDWNNNSTKLEILKNNDQEFCAELIGDDWVFPGEYDGTVFGDIKTFDFYLFNTPKYFYIQ